jgi:hypothetical protein
MSVARGQADVPMALRQGPPLTLAVQKRKSSKRDENDVLQFDLKVECDCELVAYRGLG